MSAVIKEPSKSALDSKEALELEILESPIVLLDVDETLAISNSHYGVYDGGYRYHQPLIDALKQVLEKIYPKDHPKEVYLFTAYLLKSIAKTPEEEPIGSVSRLKLRQYLESC